MNFSSIILICKKRILEVEEVLQGSYMIQGESGAEIEDGWQVRMRPSDSSDLISYALCSEEEKMQRRPPPYPRLVSNAEPI